MRRDIAVVIVNYRTKELTAAAVRSVLAHPEVAEVVVVDNGSGDGSSGYLSEAFSGAASPGAVVASTENLGFGRGCDLGVRQSCAPLLFFLNSDAVITPGALALLREALEQGPHVGLVAPMVYGSDGRDLQVSHGVFPSVRSIVNRTNLRPEETLHPDWVSGVAMLLRRTDYTQVGGFDPDFVMYLEDIDLCRRLRAAGKDIRLLPTASILHVGGASRRSSFEQRRQYHRSQRLYFEKAGAGRLTRAVIAAAATVRMLQSRIGKPRGSQ
ncbi:MAG: glycosyltransferase family 2 protein [Acidimicrobiales bacterium]